MKTYLRSHRIAVESFNEKGLLLKFACDMAAGLQALNQQGYIHRYIEIMLQNISSHTFNFLAVKTFIEFSYNVIKSSLLCSK